MEKLAKLCIKDRLLRLTGGLDYTSSVAQGLYLMYIKDRLKWLKIEVDRVTNNGHQLAKALTRIQKRMQGNTKLPHSKIDTWPQTKEYWYQVIVSAAGTHVPRPDVIPKKLWKKLQIKASKALPKNA